MKVAEFVTPGSPGWASPEQLRRMGASLPSNRAMAQQQAINMQTAVANRTLAASVNRERLRNQRLGAIKSGGANIQMAMPKMRQPLSTLTDKGIPHDVTNDESLKEIRRWARMFYLTHDLVPLLIDIYSKFPVVGLEFQSKDPLIKKFYEQMFFEELNYMEFLPSLGREFFTAGEVTSLGHFNENLGVWASEEILDPDQLQVTKSIFRDEERVQLLVADLVKTLREGPAGLSAGSEETRSQKDEREWQYQQLVRNYPEIIKAAEEEDGIEIDNALIGRLVNKPTAWASRGAPHMMRSFRTLMMEETLNAAQDAVADRLYSPFILATLGVPDLGDGMPWIPSQSELDECRDDMQAAVAADFRFMVHNFGLKIESVFGRESVPRFDQDYDRIDEKILQAWGIGKSLISGGDGGPYASSALNREFVTQMMVTFQNSLKKFMLKRAEVVAEAQQHYDYELKGGTRVPLFREVLEYDEETGEEYTVRVPKLLLPDIKFSTLNLRDEAQERQFMTQLKDYGVPISDGTLSVNIPIEFEQELEKQSEETVAKLVASSQAMAKAQAILDEKRLPYPPELADFLSQTLLLRSTKSETEMSEGQAEMMDLEKRQNMPAGQLGWLPGTSPMPVGGDEEGESEGSGSSFAASKKEAIGMPLVKGPQAGNGEVLDAEIEETFDNPEHENKSSGPLEVPRNRARPVESDEMRNSQPKMIGGRPARLSKRQKFGQKPSSSGQSLKATPEDAQRAVRRLELVSSHVAGTDIESLIRSDDFWSITSMGAYQSQVLGDWSEIQAGGGSMESRELLREAIEIYEEMMGVQITGVNL